MLSGDEEQNFNETCQLALSNVPGPIVDSILEQP
jgi:hypothetical protein